MGAERPQELDRHALIDECRLCIHPMVTGHDAPMLRPSDVPLRLSFGVVMLRDERCLSGSAGR